jgi:hypothetical protein
MSSRRIIILFVALELVIAGIAVAVDGFSVSALQTTTRFSGRLSLFLFSAIFLLHHKPETLHVWLSTRFYLLFAIVHGIHLVELLSYIYLSGTPLVPIRVAGGFLAYAFIFLMPVLSDFENKGRISRGNFVIVQTVFLYYVWLLFFLTYLPRVQGKLPNAGGHYAEHVALLGWVSTMLGIKLTNLIQFKKIR